jgi:uncharacterized iron-regulated membrane protein
MTTPVKTGWDHNRVLKLLRKLHGWLGVFIFPLVFIAGLTGVYMNHGKIFKPYVEPTEIGSMADGVGGSHAIAEGQAKELVRQIWGHGVKLKSFERKRLYGFESFVAKRDGEYGQIIVAIPNGRYVIKSAYFKRTFSPEGDMVALKFYWRSILKGLHTGRIGGDVGRYIMDGVSITLMLFALSGFYLWTVPRWRRRRRQQAV